MCRWEGVCGVLHGKLELDITVNRRMLDCSFATQRFLLPITKVWERTKLDCLERV